MPKTTQVEVEVISTGVKRELEFEHALRLLSKYNTHKLPKDSKWQYEKGDLTRRKSAPKDSGGQTPQDGHTEGDTSK